MKFGNANYLENIFLENQKIILLKIILKKIIIWISLQKKNENKNNFNENKYYTKMLKCLKINHGMIIFWKSKYIENKIIIKR